MKPDRVGVGAGHSVDLEVRAVINGVFALHRFSEP